MGNWAVGHGATQRDCRFGASDEAATSQQAQYDFLYHTGRGRVAPYDPERHGLWEIHQAADGALSVRISQEAISEPGVALTETDEQGGTLALESHLRDYLAQNLANNADFGAPLTVYTSQDGRDGVEFQTDVGPIDILATTSDGDFHVFELKLGRGRLQPVWRACVQFLHATTESRTAARSPSFKLKAHLIPPKGGTTYGLLARRKPHSIAPHAK